MTYVTMRISMPSRTHEANLRTIRALLALGAATILCALTLGLTVGRARAAALTQAQYLSLAQQGIGKASAWANTRFHWYNEVLNDTKKYPQAAIWGVVPLFESEAYTAMANPNSTNVARLKTFANHAESYFDNNITPQPHLSIKTPAYAPYPNSHNNAKTFFDDNGCWSRAFVDASTAMQKANNSVLAARYLADAVRGFNFIYPNSWDTQ